MNKSHDRFDVRAMVVFLQAARKRSFTLAGEQLCMTPSAVSKAVSRIEADLGVKLLHRDPRSVTLTPEGRKFFQEAERLVEAIERARRVVSDPSPAVRGTLRVGVPINFGRTILAPQIRAFTDQHPELFLELLLINGHYDPLEKGADVALCVGDRAWIDSRLVVQGVATIPFTLCASPSYLQRQGTPREIGDLERHQTLGGIDEKTGHMFPWRFLNPDGEVSYLPKSRVLSNAVDVLANMAVDGAGIICLPSYMAVEPIAQGRLTPVLPKLRLAPSHFHIVCLQKRADDPAVRAIVELLSGLLARVTAAG